MAAIPWMPLYVADYLADTGHLGTIDHGAYFLMMMHYWTKGPLTDDEGQLRKIARMTAREWSASRDVLLALFFHDAETGRYHHKRIDAELATAAEMIDAKSKAGVAGAKKRWQTHSSRIRKQNGIPNGSRIAEPLANECGRTAPLPSPEPLPSSEVRTSSDGADAQLAVLKKTVWKEAKALGIERSAIGKMFQLCGEDANALLALVRRCAENAKVGRAMEPTSWCFAELHPKPTGPPKLVAVGSAEADTQAAAAKIKAMLG